MRVNWVQSGQYLNEELLWMILESIFNPSMRHCLFDLIRDVFLFNSTILWDIIRLSCLLESDHVISHKIGEKAYNTIYT